MNGPIRGHLLAGAVVGGIVLACWLPACVAAAEADSLVVAAVSCEVKVRDRDHNLRRIAHWSQQAAARGADLVLFPECTIQGWWQSRENRKMAETIDGDAIARVAAIAKRHELVIAVGMTEKSADKYYLTHVLVGPEGVIGYHRKSSLAGGPKGEGAVWDAGEDAKVFQVGDFKLGIAICYESVHPQTCRKLQANGAEVILAPYANGTRPSEILDPQRQRRSWIWDRVRENHLWYVACDATPHGKDGQLLSGAAYAISPEGKLVACTPQDGSGEAMVVVRIPRPSHTR